MEKAVGRQRTHANDPVSRDLEPRSQSTRRRESRSDFVAVVAVGQGAPVRREEIEAFAATYCRIRGSERCVYSPEEGRVCAAAFPPAGDDGGDCVLSGPQGWSVATGVLIGPELPQASLAGLDGHFGVVSFQPESDTALVGTDPMGMQSVFIAQRANRAYVSTSALAVARHLQLRADAHRLLSFLRAGYHFGEATHWQGLRRLNPGATIEFGREATREALYWRPERDTTVDSLRLDEAVDHALDVMLTTVTAYFSSQACTWADLSGGYDSRLLSLALDRAGVRFKSCTRGDPHNAEVRIARRIAELEGWEWTLFSYPENWHDEVRPLFETSLAWSDGHRSVLHVAQRFWKHARTAVTCRSLVGGGAGELLRNFFWQQEFHQAGRSNEVNFANLINMRLLHPMRTTVFPVDPTPAVRADFEHRLRQWIEPYSSELNTTQLDVIYAYKSTGTYGIEGSAERRFHFRHWPFLYQPIVVAALSTNFRHRRGHRLIRHMMQRLDPMAASILTSPWGGPAEPIRISNAYRFLPYYYDVGKRATAKALEKASRGAVTRQRTGNERRRLLRAAFLQWGDATLDGGLDPATMRTASLLDVGMVRELIERGRREDSADLEILDRLITLELALQVADSAVES